MNKNVLAAENKKLQNLVGFNQNFICCKESRIESPTSFYGCFYVGPFDESLAQTLAHNLRRTLLSELPGLAITAVEIDGVLHQFSSINGTKETVLDILCNLQNIVLKSNSSLGTYNLATKTDKPLLSDSLLSVTSLANQYKMNSNPFSKNIANVASNISHIAHLRVRGPGNVKASDIILPAGIECVNPDQHIATISEDTFFNMKLYIGKGKNAIKQSQKTNISASGENQNAVNGNPNDPHFVLPTTSQVASSNTDDKTDGSHISNRLTIKKKTNKIFLDSVFMPVTKVNAFVETNFKATDSFEAKRFDGEVQINKRLASDSTNEKSQKGSKFDDNASANLSKSQTRNIAFVDESNNNQQETSMLVLSHSSKKVSDLNPNLAHFISQNPSCLIKPTRQSHVVLEIWTNGSVHPRQALQSALDFLATTFMTLNNVKILGSMYKSDITYKKILASIRDLE